VHGLLWAVLLVVGSSTSFAQNWPDWAEEAFGRRHYEAPRKRHQDLEEPERRTHDGKRQTTEVRDGGPRPVIQAVSPPIVPFSYDFKANSIVIDVGERKLYYVLADNQAYAYPIGVGREGFGWTGTETISRKQEWPDWHPPAEMRERDPSLPEKMTGGLKNPLGAMALYLGTTLYRIHGTNDAKSIGGAESSGCFRMLNSAVLHLASVTEIGTPVTVITSLPAPKVSHATEPRTARPVEPRNPSTASPVASKTSPAPHPPDYRTLRDLTLKEQ
jgi:lipoprotein-anchoring transpeptidase ErfK/SrfK